MKALYFDLDATLCGLYDYPNWLELLHEENTEPYEKAAPLVNMSELNNILSEFVANGVVVGVISWGAMNGSNEYTRRTKKAKVNWCEQYVSCFTEYHVVKYGTAKHTVAKIKDSILVDDNADVRKAWKNGATIDASNSEEMMKNLRQLLDTIKAA